MLTRHAPPPPRATRRRPDYSIGAIVAALWLLVVADATAQQGPAARADASAPVAAVRVATDVHALQVRRADFATATRRAFVQDLSVDAADAARTVALHVRASTSFDQALAARPRLEVLRERQLDAALHAAELRWRPFAALTLRAGRVTRVTELGWQRIDGAAFRLDLPRAVWVDLSAGARAGEALASLTGTAWDTGIPIGRAGSGGLAWEVAGGHDLPGGGALGAGYRAERRDGARVVERAAAWLRLGAPGIRQLRASAALDVLRVRVAEADMIAEQRVGRSAHVFAGAAHRRPEFALDSVFSVFPTRARSSAWVGARGGRSGLQVTGRVGVATVPSTNVSATASAAAGYRWVRVWAEGSAGDARWQGQLTTSGTWSLSPAASLGVHLGASWAHDPAAVVRPTARTATVGARSTLDAGDWGTVALRLDGVLSDAAGASVEAWAAIRLALPVWTSAYRRAAQGQRGA